MDKNYILGSIAWNSNSEAFKRTTKEFKNSTLSISVDRTVRNDRSKDYYYFDEEKNVFCVVLGHISNLEEIRSKYSLKSTTDIKFIYELYVENGLKCFNELDGVFMIFLYDPKSHMSYIYQPYHGMDLPIYYFSNDEKFVFSTRLKSILAFYKEREINIEAAKDFLHFEIIVPNKNTLLKNIFKVIPGKYLTINHKNEEIIQKSVTRKLDKVSMDYAKNNLINTIKVSFLNTFKYVNKQNYAITHTKGWDSNLLLYFANDLSNDTIQTITINGGGKINEVPYAKEIKKSYPKLKSITANVQKDIFNQLVDLVWIYEGYLFQEGTFLRYELAKTLKNKNIKTLILGAPVTVPAGNDARKRSN